MGRLVGTPRFLALVCGLGLLDPVHSSICWIEKTANTKPCLAMRIRGGGGMGLLLTGSMKIEMTNQERAKLLELKEVLSEELKDLAKRTPELGLDDRVLRFLRCYKLDVERYPARDFLLSVLVHNGAA